jgi:hypothetical protein
VTEDTEDAALELLVLVSVVRRERAVDSTLVGRAVDDGESA